MVLNSCVFRTPTTASSGRNWRRLKSKWPKILMRWGWFTCRQRFILRMSCIQCWTQYYIAHTMVVCWEEFGSSTLPSSSSSIPSSFSSLPSSSSSLLFCLPSLLRSHRPPLSDNDFTYFFTAAKTEYLGGLWWQWVLAPGLHQTHAGSTYTLPGGHWETQPLCESLGLALAL